ncbi:MAG: hypothetical protein A2V93_12635 [Ignavibacteria bacterium RBG_16_34_14]|nr:MAG: hypothetical protein A2V93_12635 [Ignavibacteria bacterium RBG_16_34_14]
MIIHFYLERKFLKNPEKNIYAYIRGLHQDKTLILNTGQKINPLNWDKEFERAFEKGINKSAGAKELNYFLDSYKEDIKRTIREIIRDNPSSDYETIKSTVLEKFGRVQKSQLSFFEALDLFITTRKKDLSYDSIRKFTTIKNHLIEFEKSERIKLTFAKIDMLFYDKLLNFLLDEKKNVNNSAYKIIGLLKIFLKWAYDRGINKNLTFQRYKIKEEKVDIVTLTNQELDKISGLDLSRNKRLDKARDLFVFGCYTGGRFSDLSKIGWEDIKENTWYLRVKKTRDVLEIPLLDEAIALINKYKDQPTPLPRISNQKLNVYIKEVCVLTEINDPVKIIRYRGNEPLVFEGPKNEFVSAHTARRTFITQSLLRGMKAEIVMSISGHKNFKTFKKYLDITRKDKQEELRKAWNKPTLSIVNFNNE